MDGSEGHVAAVDGTSVNVVGGEDPKQLLPHLTKALNRSKSGSKLCDKHGNMLSLCIACKALGVHGAGARICEHLRQQNLCVDCGGVSICEHGARRTRCKACNVTPPASEPPSHHQQPGKGRARGTSGEHATQSTHKQQRTVSASDFVFPFSVQRSQSALIQTFPGRTFPRDT